MPKHGRENFLSTKMLICLFNFKLTEFFIVKPYETLPSSWLDFLRSQLAFADGGGQCGMISDGKENELLRPEIQKLFLSIDTRPDDLLKFLTDADILTISRKPWEAGK